MTPRERATLADELFPPDPTASGTLRRENPLVRLFGTGPDGSRCRDCALLVRHEAGSTWFKCRLRPLTNGKATDHRATWPACSKFEAGAPTRVLHG